MRHPVPLAPGDREADCAVVRAPGSAVEEDVADDARTTIIVQSPGPQTDAAVAHETMAEARREGKRDQWRTPVLVLGVLSYVGLSAVAIATVFFMEEKVESLLQVYALIMPVLTAVIGAAIGFLFAGGRPGGS